MVESPNQSVRNTRFPGSFAWRRGAATLPWKGGEWVRRFLSKERAAEFHTQPAGFQLRDS